MVGQREEPSDGPAPPESQEGAVKEPVRPLRRSRSEIQKAWKKTASSLLLKQAIDGQRSEQVANLAMFAMERSDGDLDWKWSNVGEKISECNDPARPPPRGMNKQFVHFKLRRTVENIYFRLFTMLLIILDIGFVITEAVLNCAVDPTSKTIRNLELALSVYFVVEVLLRMIALTPKVFFSKKSWYNIVDFFVVILAFGASIAAMIIVKRLIQELGDDHIREKICQREATEENVGTGKGVNTYVLMNMISALRIIRIFRLVRVCRLYFEHHNLVKGVRQRISENKRRYQVDGYDLDLTYVTTNIIAMSFPSKGTKAVYRNKIDQVAKFFEDKYSNTQHIDYMIYNLCSEMEYDHRKFHGNVRRYQIDDHNVPSIDEMIKLVEDVGAWLRGGEGRERVVALHCKGGKGRTGTMICAVLIGQNLFENAGESLTYFGQRRTDLNVAQQFQGVETYSQIRYVHYFQEAHNQRLKAIPSRPLRVVKIIITGLKRVGVGDGSDFSVTITEGAAQQLQCSFKPGSDDCQIKHDPKVDRLEVNLTNPPIVNKDVKFLFTCSTKSVPKGYDDCAFFFWLNTFFIKNYSELMTREQLDNPHKEKVWRVWRENFSVEVVFQNPEQAASHL